MITDPEFEAYKEDPYLCPSVIRIQKFLLPRLEPIILRHKLMNTPYPLTEESYDSYIKRNYRLDADCIYNILNTDPSVIDEIVSMLEEILNVMPYMQAEYTVRTQTDWNIFMYEVVEHASKFGANLNLAHDVPYNPNFKRDLKNNKSFLYDTKIKTENTGMRYLISKEDTLRLILDGFKWKKFTNENNIAGGGIFDFLI
jgi:hypothetical protein